MHHYLKGRYSFWVFSLILVLIVSHGKKKYIRFHFLVGADKIQVFSMVVM